MGTPLGEIPALSSARVLSGGTFSPECPSFVMEHHRGGGAGFPQPTVGLQGSVQCWGLCDTHRVSSAAWAASAVTAVTPGAVPGDFWMELAMVRAGICHRNQ